jgi:general stress protein YciG
MSCNDKDVSEQEADSTSGIPSSSPIEGGIVDKRRRGFAVMEPGRQREIASKGGKAAHEKGTAHRWSEQEAKEAGRKGGAASHRNGHRTASRKEPEPNGVPS